MVRRRIAAYKSAGQWRLKKKLIQSWFKEKLRNGKARE